MCVCIYSIYLGKHACVRGEWGILVHFQVENETWENHQPIAGDVE